jgi:hypothetical protein
MTRQILTASMLALLAGLPASADQFVVRLAEAPRGASDDLKNTLHVSEIDSFSENGAHYVIIDAPGEAYVEAYYFAIHQDPAELYMLDANWTTPAFSSLPIEQRLDFLHSVDCDFCTS